MHSIAAGRRPELIAPRWHTVAFVAFLLAGPVFAGVLAAAGTPVVSSPRITTQYVPFLAVEWGFVLFLWLGGLRPYGTTLASLVGVQWSRRDVAVDSGLAIAGWSVVAAVELVWPGQRAAEVLPVGSTEKAVWIIVAVTAAFAEALIFRGYLQRQIAALLGRRWIAIGAQAALFAVVHGEQGAQAALKIGMYGLALGVMADARKSLRPGMLCHAMIDLLSGLFGV